MDEKEVTKLESFMLENKTAFVASLMTTEGRWPKVTPTEMLTFVQFLSSKAHSKFSIRHA